MRGHDASWRGPGAWVRRHGWTLLALALAGLDLSRHLFRNWVSVDEGSLGLAARLVREGKWPHADFTDIYSGGLALFDAAAQRAFGDSLVALRIPFGIATILWVGLLAACFRRYVPPAAAAALALVAYLVGPPAYTAAMPTWYLLYLATAVIWCLLRWDETGEVRWWGAAGALIGLALFIKINALFILAATGSILLTDERIRSGATGILVIALGVVGAWVTVSNNWPAGNAATLVLPLVALTASAAWHRQRGPGSAAPAPAGPLRPLGMLALGVLAVVGPWLVAYAIHGGLGALVNGVLILPFTRSIFARLLAPAPWLPDLLAILLLVGLIHQQWSDRGAVRTAILLALLALCLTASARLQPGAVIQIVWRELRVWGVVATLLVAFERVREPGPRGGRIMIAGWVAAWFALLQYPFAAPNYFAYVAPLLLLAGTAAAARAVPRPIGAALAAGLALWSVGVDHGQPLSYLGYRHDSPPVPLSRLALPRGGIIVPEADARIFEGVVAQLDRWGARTIVAGPDAPEVYYLSGRPFPDREFFEFMAPDWSASRFAERIREHQPDAVVLNGLPLFSPIGFDSIVAPLRRRAIAETIIGPFLLLRFTAPPTP